MTIQEVPYYRLVCDCCGDPCDYGDYSAWSDPGHASDQGAAAGWQIIGGVDLCDSCWMWPDVGDTDDDDNPVRAHEVHPGQTPGPPRMNDSTVIASGNVPGTHPDGSES